MGVCACSDPLPPNLGGSRFCCCSGTGTDDTHHRRLGLTDIVEQRTVGRTRELARATLDTADHFLVFGTLPVLYGSKLSQQVRLKAHRTGTDALGTADTGVGLLAEGLFTGNDGHGVGSLADGHLDTGQGLTHHRTACQQLVVALGHTATSVDEILHRSTHTNEEVAGVLQLLTGHGGIALEQGLVLHHGLVDGEGSAHILYDSTYVDRNSWGCRYLTKAVPTFCTIAPTLTGIAGGAGT